MTGRAELPDGGHLAYAVRGAGPPVLLLRPVGGSMVCWGRFADVLAAKARVIAFDARGTGESSPAALGTTTQSMATDAAALLDHLGVSRAHVFGLSLGGMVATWLAITAPGKVGRLILASTMPRGREVRPGALFRGLAMARSLARSPAEAEASLVTLILSKKFRAEHPEAVRDARALARRFPASHRGLLTMLAAAAQHDALGQLSRIAAPTLVLEGELDPLLSKRSHRELLVDIPGARFEVLAGVGHDLSIEAPEACAQHVLGFLDG